LSPAIADCELRRFEPMRKAAHLGGLSSLTSPSEIIASAAPKSVCTTCFGSAPRSIAMKTLSIQLFFQYRS
jgi:hypothetical protein